MKNTMTKNNFEKTMIYFVLKLPTQNPSCEKSGEELKAGTDEENLL